MLDRTSNDCIKSVNLTQVSFACPVAADKSRLAFVTNDLASRLITCHVLRLGNAKQVATFVTAVSESFRLNNGEIGLYKGDIKKHLAKAAKQNAVDFALNSGRELGRFTTQWLGFKQYKKTLNQIHAEQAFQEVQTESGSKPPLQVQVLITETRITLFSLDQSTILAEATFSSTR
jgi:hypothetical protein